MFKNNSLDDTPFLNNIVYAEKLNGYSVLIMKDHEQIIVDDSLNDVENSLPSGTFFRVHRSYILNLAEVTEFFSKKNNLFASLYNGKIIPVARRRRKKLLSRLLIIS